MKRTRSVTPAGRSLKRRKAMTKEEARVFTETSTAVLPRSLVPRGMPKRMYTKLRYFEQVTIDPTSGAATAAVFRLNSCYDPVFATGGRQPKGLDQWFGLYDKGVVTSARMVCKYVGPASSFQAVYGISLRTDTTLSIGTADYVEDPHSVFAIGNIYEPNQEVIINYTPKWFGDSKTESAQEDDELHFTNTADCSKPCFAHVFVGALQSGQDPTGAWLQVLIEYNVCFFEPNTLPLS